MTKTEKFNKAKRLSAILAEIKLLEDEKAKLSAELCDYVAETGDDVFVWPGAAIRLSYVKGSAPKAALDNKLFVQLAKQHMTADSYAACVAQATKMNNGRKPYFR